MELGETLYVTTRKGWRSWLARNHASAKEIWLVFPRAASERRLPYYASVEEALCYGWIDSVVKGVDDRFLAQRFSPRRPGSSWSALNLERLRSLTERGKMTRAGLAAAAGAAPARRIPPDIEARLKSDPVVWRNFKRFPASYRRIRVGWIEGARNRPEVFEKRLRHLLAMTAQNKRYGMER